ncbi:MAG TPA: ABC transporter permease [Gemmatimonadaceae bacterium]|nr:ABC transporter permease [Gemmatimonadaceae bacterium]
MRWLHRFGHRLRALWRGGRLDRELDAELQFHLEMEAAANERAGMTPADARGAALHAFGGVARWRDEARDSRGVAPLEELARDVRFGLRSLRKAPGYTAAAVATLALGIGATTAIYGAVDRVLLEPLPFPAAERIVAVRQRNAQGSALVAPANFLDLRERATAFEQLGAFIYFSHDFQSPEGPESIESRLVTEGFLRVFGVGAQLGRVLGPEDFVDAQRRVIVLSDGVWRERFGADPAIVGRAVTLDLAPWTVVGVMPPGYERLVGGRLWAPLVEDDDFRRERAGAYLTVAARLRPGITVEAAAAELGAIARVLAAEHPRTNADVELVVTPLKEQLLGGARPALLVLLGAVACLFAIACANVANLLLARTLRRERELAIRAALGAGRWRVIRQLAVESALLAGLGAVAGLAVAFWGVRLIRTLGPADLPRLDELAVDTRLVGVAVLASALAAVVAATVPALRLLRHDVGDALKAGARTVASGRATRAARAALAGGQVALAVLLLVGAGLLGRSLRALLDQERGYRTDGVATMSVQAWQHYPTRARRAEYVRLAVEQLRTLPGALAAGATSSLPLAGPIGADDATYSREGDASGEAARAHAVAVAGDYFDVLGIPLRRGRRFDRTDDAAGPGVVIVNEALARRAWPGEDPVGKRMRVAFAAAPVVREVVGVVGDVRHEGLDREPTPTVFVPHAQAATGAMIFTVRTAGDAASLVKQMREALFALTPSMPVADEATLEGLLDDSLRERRFQLSVLGAFAIVALLLAAVGTYGVISQATGERTREIGVRMALGARQRDVVALVMRQGGGMAAVGAALGLLGAAAATRGMRSMLFGVGPLDPPTLAAGAAVVLAAAAAACWLPARRAARIDPTDALRTD